MEIQISYADAKKRHPELVAEIVERLRSGKSKDKKAAPSKLKWFYNWGECIKCDTFADIMAKAANPVKPVEPTAAEKIKERIERSFVALQGNIGKWRGLAVSAPVWNGPTSFHAGFQGKPPGKCPPEVKAVITKTEKESEATRKRVAAMSDEERQAEVEGLLGQLRGTPGFVEMQIPVEIPSADGIQVVEGEPSKPVRPKGLKSFLKLYGAGGK